MRVLSQQILNAVSENDSLGANGNYALKPDSVVTPKSGLNGFRPGLTVVAEVHPAFVEKIFDVPER